ncbi:hypothetical protein BP5796_04087 [Coleophoma crateriformis]|uniref:Uncharacterized protein n=1 Tax=Coleophoma crateriformis TaxID=565419 RepID=A0A3D8SHL1_9HELO|nr:hypothetical protein BP5796_04087 [Coleophoma crateriformis]
MDDRAGPSPQAEQLPRRGYWRRDETRICANTDSLNDHDALPKLPVQTLCAEGCPLSYLAAVLPVYHLDQRPASCSSGESTTQTCLAWYPAEQAMAEEEALLQYVVAHLDPAANLVSALDE